MGYKHNEQNLFPSDFTVMYVCCQIALSELYSEMCCNKKSVQKKMKNCVLHQHLTIKSSSDVLSLN